MRIGGLQKLTLLDFPGKVACTVFLQGCNLRCPFCHNTPLLHGVPEIPREEVLRFLRSRRGLLDGVAISGGEPLLSDDLGDLLREIRALGFLIKLDTNGTYPDRLEALLRDGLIDQVAMDIKNTPDKYALTVGRDGAVSAVEESLALLRGSAIPYELRTTVVDELHEPEDFHAIGKWLRGAPSYFLQSFVDSGDILQPGFHAPSPEKLEQCRAIACDYIPNTQIRGI